LKIESGQQLLHYRLIEKIGEGGMGVVWKAVDTTLDREVAIKVLPDMVAAGPERLARFEREAKVLASLNHPNIAAIHGLQEVDGDHFLVLELIEGEDLAARMSRGAIPVNEAVALAAQIAEALEAAHESQIVHRDLKPANVRVTPDGRVKVLDFGLAKVWAPDASDSSLSFSPTITSAMTQAGVILGTAAYMSPEQARGQDVDKRSDIWAFGVLVYEMLVGVQLFAGETATDILGAIVHRKPEWESLPKNTPPALVRLLKRCLTMELSERLRDIGEARYALAHLDDEPLVESATPAVNTTGASRWKLVAGLFFLLSAILVATSLFSGSAPREVMQLSIEPPEGLRVLSTSERGGQVRISPDGRAITFVAQDDAGETQVWVRPLDARDARPVPGTEGGSRPFWSPDSRSVGFFSGGKLRRVSLDGGGALTVADATSGRGGDWNADGVIVFSPAPGAKLQRVSAAGGQPVEVTSFAEEENGRESSHREPRFLPDGQHFLYLAQSSEVSGWKVLVGNVDGRAGHFVTTTSGGAFYAEGYLLTLQGTTLVAQKFDSDAFTLSGDPMPVAEDITLDPSYGIGVFSAGPGGLLAYESGSSVNKMLTWVSADGDELPAFGMTDNYEQFALSPDASRVAVTIQEADGLRDVWIIDLARGTRTRLTFSSKEQPQEHGEPLWSPDGKWLAYISNRSGNWDVYRKPTDGVGNEELLISAEADLWCYDWSRDGKYILYGHEIEEHQNSEDLIAFPVSGEGEPVRVTNAPFHEWPAVFSPDSRFVAYDSPESGRREIYVVPFPGLEGRWQVSAEGGRYPHWSPDGSRLYFWNHSRLMMAPVRGEGSTFQVGAVEEVLKVSWGSDAETWAIHPDGDKFLVLAPDGRVGKVPTSLFLNWQEELVRR